jgi:hypothetical protein
MIIIKHPLPHGRIPAGARHFAEDGCKNAIRNDPRSSDTVRTRGLFREFRLVCGVPGRRELQGRLELLQQQIETVWAEETGRHPIDKAAVGVSFTRNGEPP